MLKGYIGVVISVVVVLVVLICYCWIVGMDGIVWFWDFVVGVLIRIVEVGYLIVFMVIFVLCILWGVEEKL